jgi:endonuclease/exonuclease/phosphatase family metal-dependent hydrolase
VPALTLATWNLLHGRSLQHGQVRADDLTAGAKMLDADVVALQEVDRGQERSHRIDLTAVVAEATGAVWWRFLPTLRGVPGGSWDPMGPEEHGDPGRPEYGIGLVSRLPVLEWDVLRFAAAPYALPLLVPGQGLVKVPDEPRAALVAVLAGPSGPLTVAATHLSFVPGFNIRQLRQLTRLLADKPAPRVVLGDLNMPSALPRLATGWTQLARTATYPSWKPRVQFDHVLAQGIGPQQVLRVDSVRAPVSDHNALAVTLTL